MNKNNPVASNCTVSHPILYPEQEIVQFNGFAWSNSQGIILQSLSSAVQLDPSQWLGTQE